jgi:hypothetical protein
MANAVPCRNPRNHWSDSPLAEVRFERPSRVRACRAESLCRNRTRWFKTAGVFALPSPISPVGSGSHGLILAGLLRTPFVGSVLWPERRLDPEFDDGLMDDHDVVAEKLQQHVVLHPSRDVGSVPPYREQAIGLPTRSKSVVRLALIGVDLALTSPVFPRCDRRQFLSGFPLERGENLSRAALLWAVGTHPRSTQHVVAPSLPIKCR